MNPLSSVFFLLYSIFMDLLKAALLGIVEGLTEFLPVSSTAHIILTSKALGFRDTAELFTVVVQLGAIAAATWYFRRDLIYITKAILGRDRSMITFARNCIIGLLPTFVIGFTVQKLFGIPDSLAIIAPALVIGGIIFLWVEGLPHPKSPKDGAVNYEAITGKCAALIGLGQSLAIIPGVSRSGATIITGLLTGLDRKTAAVFSFYLGIPVMIGASALKLKDDSSMITSVTGGSTGIIIGTLAAFVSALLVVNWLMKYIVRHNFRPFAYYRIALGLSIAAWLMIK
jgi:undecaprenyl-diphosphatase